MKATDSKGSLQPTGCYIIILGTKIQLNILPEISDSKSASYNDETIMGRSFPIKSFAHGDNRTISMTTSFYADTPDSLTNNIKSCRLIQSAVYPRDNTDNGAPYTPPPICKLYCSSLISTCALCVTLKRYNLRIPRDIQWDEKTMTPYFFTMDLEFDVVNDNNSLPGQEKIFGDLPGQSNCSDSSSSSSSGGNI